MKRWREASTLIVTAVKSRTLTVNVNEYDSQDGRLTSRSHLTEKSDFHIVALKKTGESAGAPELCVFPGESISSADSSSEWERIYSRFGCKIETLSSRICNENTDLPIFRGNPTEGIPRWLSLRISAIRETFEECGILICRKKNDTDLTSTCHFHIDDSDTWRNKVFNDPYEFINYANFMIVTQMCSLFFLWGNWLTPVNFKKRYDAVFFLTILDKTVPATPDLQEIHSVQDYQ